MLFDLRSRGRRRTVQAVYLGLAILIGGGLVLFGVGAGNGIGGILNAFSGGGGGGATTAVSQEDKAALKATQQRPTDPQAWAQLVQASWTTAIHDTDTTTSPPTFTAAGKKELRQLGNAWQRYLQLTKTPDPTLAIYAARGSAALGQYAQEASAWEIATLANPNSAHGYECLAVSAYAASQTRKGDLAAAKALSLVPKIQRTQINSLFQQAKTQSSTAHQIAQSC
jgi:hypothetical protein